MLPGRENRALPTTRLGTNSNMKPGLTMSVSGMTIVLLTVHPSYYTASVQLRSRLERAQPKASGLAVSCSLGACTHMIQRHRFT